MSFNWRSPARLAQPTTLKKVVVTHQRQYKHREQKALFVAVVFVVTIVVAYLPEYVTQVAKSDVTKSVVVVPVVVFSCQSGVMRHFQVFCSSCFCLI